MTIEMDGTVVWLPIRNGSDVPRVIVSRFADPADADQNETGHGVYRVGGTRVTLDLVVRAFDRGATAEEIVQKLPSLELSDVYQVIGYYLKYRGELSEYL